MWPPFLFCGLCGYPCGARGRSGDSHMRFVFLGAVALAIVSLNITAGPVQAADTGAFSKSCSGSKSLGAMFAANAGDRAQSDVATLCSCIATAIAPTATDNQLALLAANVTGTMTDAQTDAYNKDESTQKLAMDAMNGCLESTGLAKDYGG